MASHYKALPLMGDTHLYPPLHILLTHPLPLLAGVMGVRVIGLVLLYIVFTTRGQKGKKSYVNLDPQILIGIKLQNKEKGK